jgi:predicted DsbA family dithiol-disulfide isomerase
MTTALPIDMVSDVVCPWCFIGKRRLEKAIALRPDIAVEVRFRPISSIRGCREGIGRDEYLTTKLARPRAIAASRSASPRLRAEG